MASTRWRTWDPVPKWVAQGPLLTWRIGAPAVKWLAQPPTSDDTPEGASGMFQLSTLATTYVRVPVYADQLGAVVNPTSYTVQMALISGPDNPGSGDWKAASWTTTAQGQYVAQCLVGPSGTVTLTAGLTYNVWIQIAASPETVVINTGQIQAV